MILAGRNIRLSPHVGKLERVCKPDYPPKLALKTLTLMLILPAESSRGRGDLRVDFIIMIIEAALLNL